ncbi:MAG TPA: condensation domain-containing protein, partial [Thermoanaerobaculia bacterium]
PAVWELWAPLAAGARLVMAEPGGHRDPAYLVRALAAHRATVARVVPALLEALAAEPGLPACPGLRRLLCGGEALPPAAGAAFLDRAAAELWNSYGPAETTITATLHRVAREPGRVPLGRAVGPVSARVLDRRLAPAPVGAAGELALAGPTLARGYLERPAETAERFVPDPFGPPGARLYRTGDRARTLADGRLDFLGRLDRQVKLGGVRLELGEVEALLREYPRVAEAAAVVREDRPGDRRLAAYVALAPGAPETAAGELLEALRRRLPAAVGALALTVLPALPRTPGGKLDRLALPAPADRAGRSGAPGPAPAGPVAELIAQVWRELLDVDRVSAGDDFFALGGHSLLAIRACARLRDLLGVEVPVRALFERPTPAGLGAWAEAALRRGPGPDDLPLVPAPRDGELPATFAQERIWFLDRFPGERRAYGVPAALSLWGPLRTAALASALAALVARHEALRTVLPPAEGSRTGARLAVLPPAPPALPLVDLAGIEPGRRAAEARRLAAEDARRPFDLARGPVLRTALLCLGAAEHRLLLTLHHAATDAWSNRLLRRELAVLYRARVEGVAAELPELPVQYADFALWQRRRLAGGRRVELTERSRERLAGAPTVLDLPVDRPRPAERSSRGGSVRRVLPAAAAEALERVGREHGATPFMTLLAAFQVLLGRLTGADDLLVGTPVSGRDRSELEGVVGLFLDTVVVRGRLDGDPAFGALLARTREEVLAAFACREAPFEDLVGALVTERSLARPPLVQAGLTLEAAPEAPAHAAGGSVEAAGLEIAPWTIETGAVKLELSLAARPSAAGLELRLDFARDLFDETTARRWLGSFEALLRQAAEDPERPVSRLDLLSAPERQALLREWGAGPAPRPPAAGTLHGLVAAR